MNSKGLAQLAYEKGMYVLAAAQSYQVAVGSGKLGHGYLSYALVEEGLKAAKADDAPKDGQVLLREWLDSVVRRVPQIQEKGLKEEKDIVQLGAAAKGQSSGKKSSKENDLQRPQVFYRREAEARPLIVARP